MITFLRKLHKAFNLIEIKMPISTVELFPYTPVLQKMILEILNVYKKNAV